MRVTDPAHVHPPQRAKHGKFGAASIVWRSAGSPDVGQLVVAEFRLRAAELVQLAEHPETNANNI